MKKILLVTSKFPWPISGASESDRAHGIQQLIRLGYDIRVITKVSKDKISSVQPIAETLGIKIYPVPYRNYSVVKKYVRMLGSRPRTLDGAAYEYAEPWITEVFDKQYQRFKPDWVWLDMTFIWPLATRINRAQTKVVLRSQNDEALHFLEEEGNSLINRLIYKAKMHTESYAAKIADVLFAITPHEEDFYRSLGGKKVFTLPLRGLSQLLSESKFIQDKPPYHVYFPCSTFNVKHNKRALQMILCEIAPMIEKQVPGVFHFHIFGTKFPKEYANYLNAMVTHDGSVVDINADEMDIALVPSLSGRGMQQKIFEPLSRGIPTITSARGINGYPFNDGEQVVLATSAGEYVSALISLQDSNLRKHLSKNAIKTAQQLFSQERLDTIVKSALVDI